LSINNLAQEHRSSVSRGSYTYKFNKQDFENTPLWNQEEGEPPLSVSRAIKIARENLPRFVKSAETWKIRVVTLQSIGENENKWFYRIDFFCTGAVCQEVEDRIFTAIVKMDGTILEPKRVTIEN
jgi:hypothetical protein